MSNRNVSSRGRFIVFEGIDGSGKSTQVALLSERLLAAGHRVHVTLEPSNRPIGRLLRDILTGKEKADERAISALFLADRLDHITADVDGMLDRLAAGETVICDRYYFSSLAYNSLKVSMDWVLAAHQPVFDLLRPDIVLYLDLPIAESLRRIHANRDGVEHYEKEETLVQVRENYFAAFRKLEANENIQLVDATQDVAAVSQQIWSLISVLKPRVVV
ncbi:MAG TPA: dTMP kinase [Bacteroidetes bacterium]|nr:dTMP kinase [Bacteroidota bacterium]